MSKCRRKWTKTGDKPNRFHIKVALYKDVASFQYLELKTHFVITQDTTKNELPDERKINQL